MLYERRRWRRRSTPDIRRSLARSESVCRDTGSVRDMSKSRLRRATSRSLREFWQVDGSCDVLLASHLPQDEVSRKVSIFAMRRHAVMDDIRQRIAGLRRRAETAPGRLEWSA